MLGKVGIGVRMLNVVNKPPQSILTKSHKLVVVLAATRTLLRIWLIKYCAPPKFWVYQTRRPDQCSMVQQVPDALALPEVEESKSPEVYPVIQRCLFSESDTVCFHCSRGGLTKRFGPWTSWIIPYLTPRKKRWNTAIRGSFRGWIVLRADQLWPSCTRWCNVHTAIPHDSHDTRGVSPRRAGLPAAHVGSWGSTWLCIFRWE